MFASFYCIFYFYFVLTSQTASASTSSATDRHSLIHVTRWYSSICWGRQWLAAKAFHGLDIVTIRIQYFMALQIYQDKKKNCGQQFKKCILIESLKENISICINPSFNLTHVLAGFTEGLIMCFICIQSIFLSRGRQQVNRDLRWGVWCTHRHRLSLALSLSFLCLLWSYCQPSDVPVPGLAVCYENQDNCNGGWYNNAAWLSLTP